MIKKPDVISSDRENSKANKETHCITAARGIYRDLNILKETDVTELMGHRGMVNYNK